MMFTDKSTNETNRRFITNPHYSPLSQVVRYTRAPADKKCIPTLIRWLGANVEDFLSESIALASGVPVGGVSSGGF